jgi:hypothetical protein
MGWWGGLLLFLLGVIVGMLLIIAFFIWGLMTFSLEVKCKLCNKRQRLQIAFFKLFEPECRECKRPREEVDIY